jgi:hypothetical protein
MEVGSVRSQDCNIEPVVELSERLAPVFPAPLDKSSSIGAATGTLPSRRTGPDTDCLLRD